MGRKLQFDRTDRDITDAFLRILSEKPFEKITVQDIITEAMVNRSTFYQHFSDKYAILEMLQKKYVSELTDLVKDIRTQGGMGLKQIDQVMENFFSKNRQTLRLLLNIRTEHMDIRKEFRTLFTDYFCKNSDYINDLEAYLLSGLWLDFFTYCLEHDVAAENYSTLFYKSYYRISLLFFQLEENKEAQSAFLDLIGAHTRL